MLQSVFVTKTFPGFGSDEEAAKDAAYANFNKFLLENPFFDSFLHKGQEDREAILGGFGCSRACILTMELHQKPIPPMPALMAVFEDRLL